MSSKTTTSQESLRLKATCSKCKDLYKDPRKLTNCSHVFCLECIRKYMLSQRPINYPSCPVCKSPILTAIKDIDTLKNATSEKELAEIIRASEKCDMCQEPNYSKKCLQCSLLFCSNCETIHSKLLRNHLVTDSLDSGVTKLMYVTRECKAHNNQPLNLYCLMCFKTFCLSCDNSVHTSCLNQYGNVETYLEKLTNSPNLIQQFLFTSAERKPLLSKLTENVETFRVSQLSEVRPGTTALPHESVPVSLRVVHIQEFSAFGRHYFQGLQTELEQDIQFFKDYIEESESVIKESFSEALLKKRHETLVKSVWLIVKNGETILSDVCKMLTKFSDLEVAKVIIGYEKRCLTYFQYRKPYSYEIRLLSMKQNRLNQNNFILQQTSTCLLQEQSTGRLCMFAGAVELFHCDTSTGSSQKDTHNGQNKDSITEEEPRDLICQNEEKVLWDGMPPTVQRTDNDIPFMWIDEYNETGREITYLDEVELLTDPNLPSNKWLGKDEICFWIKTAVPEFLNFELKDEDDKQLAFDEEYSVEDKIFSVIKCFCVKRLNEESYHVSSTDNSIHINNYIDIRKGKAMKGKQNNNDSLSQKARMITAGFTGDMFSQVIDDKCVDACSYNQKLCRVIIKKTVSSKVIKCQTYFLNLLSAVPFHICDNNDVIRAEDNSSSPDIICMIGMSSEASGLETLFVDLVGEKSFAHGISVKPKVAKFKQAKLRDTMFSSGFSFLDDKNSTFAFFKASSVGRSYIGYCSKMDRKESGGNLFCSDGEGMELDVPVISLQADLLCELKSAIYFARYEAENDIVVIGKLQFKNILETEQIVFSVNQDDIMFPLSKLRPVTMTETRGGNVVVVCAIEDDKENLVMILPLEKRIERLEIQYSSVDPATDINEASVLDLEIDTDGNIMFVIENKCRKRWKVMTKYIMPE